MATASYLDRFLDPVVESFSPEFARAMIDQRVDSEMEQRIALLRNRANEGSLTAEEEDEYKDFVESVDVISILQAKARKFLNQHRD